MSTNYAVTDLEERKNAAEARLKVVQFEIEKKTTALGPAMLNGSSTRGINNELQELETEKRELLSLIKTIDQETSKASEAANEQAIQEAVDEFGSLSEQRHAKTVEVISQLCSIYSELKEVDSIQEKLIELSAVAGNRVTLLPDGVVLLSIPSMANEVVRTVEAALYQIAGLNGKENLEKAGISLPF